jgi:hypothetical protein
VATVGVFKSPDKRVFVFVYTTVGVMPFPKLGAHLMLSWHRYYEPSFPFHAAIRHPREMSEAHRRWVEDAFAVPPKALAPSAWQLVGVVEDSAENQDDGVISDTA